MHVPLKKTALCSTLLSAALLSVSTPCLVMASEIGADAPVTQSAFMNDFVRRMKNGYQRSNTFLQDAGIILKPLDLRGLPPGENLIFETRLPSKVKIDGTILAEVGEDTLLFSLRDIIQTLDFPIDYNPDTQTFSGWFIRENKTFNMDVQSGIVQSDGTEYRVSDDAIITDDDILVSLSDFESWFKVHIEPNISTQTLKLDPDYPLPIMERYERRQFEARNFTRKPAELPRGEDGYRLFAPPLIDVNTRSIMRERADSERTIDHRVNINTANEIAYGTLQTNISATDEENITNIRATYLQESAYPELLGPLKARRFELGDVLPTRDPLTGGAGPETGFRMTNADPFVRQTLPSTQITGYIFPEWDVELYRENALIDFQTTDENGFYAFNNVPLLSDENYFRIVAYGPQGEIREETAYVPFDTNRRATDTAVYDVSVTSQNRQFYQKFDSKDEDKNTPHFVGFLETPLTGNAALRLGARYRQEDGENKAYASANVSTVYQGALLNAGVAMDEQGEMGAQFVANRQFGRHRARADLNLATDNYTPGRNTDNVQTLSNSYTLEGPVPLLGIGVNPRYTASLGYAQRSDGEDTMTGLFNYNTSYRNLSYNQTFNYVDASSSATGEKINSQTSVTGTLGRSSLRGRANYEIKPDSHLDSLAASWSYNYSNELEGQIGVNRAIESGVNSYSAQLNWRPEYATISPRLTYDSEGNMEGTLNTRFGLNRVEETGDLIFSRDFISNSGAITAFVYLDKDGNKIFDGDDEPIRDATVRTPQNGGSKATDETGVAFISRLRPNLITDVYVEQNSLEDPFWIPAGEGVSVMPRTGTNVKVEIPIHIAGEMDGTVYVKRPDGTSSALRGVSLTLYDQKGEVVQTTDAGPDGFYIFSLIPPGTYSLLVDEQGIPKDITRPKPQTIEIGYDGTTIFANDITLTGGTQDVPSTILADLSDYEALHPHIDFSNTNYNIVLNLGEYESRLLTSLVWYRLNSRYGDIFAGTKLFVPPSQSYASARTGKHALRVGLNSGNLDDAYNRCRALIARNMECKVEIYPAGSAQQELAQNARNQ